MQIKGVGLVGSSGALGYMPEMGTISETQAAAFVGIEPVQDQSGTKEKALRIQGGRAELRRIIYMNAICCITHISRLKSH
jgi:transposase